MLEKVNCTSLSLNRPAHANHRPGTAGPNIYDINTQSLLILKHSNLKSRRPLLCPKCLHWLYPKYTEFPPQVNIRIFDFFPCRHQIWTLEGSGGRNMSVLANGRVFGMGEASGYWLSHFRHNLVM